MWTVAIFLGTLDESLIIVRSIAEKSSGGFKVILKNNKISRDRIKEIRESLKEETKDVRDYLGIDSNNLKCNFPIRDRDFSIWIYLDDCENLIGTLTYEVEESNVVFLKIFYILPEYRNKGYGRKMIEELLKVYPSVSCKINKNNIKMQKLVKKLGFKGEKNSRINSLFKKEQKPLWWSKV